ncbi:MAG: esterase family protein [Actinobacteria bacterium]|nr:esterase family protein [Actinomycetota bacterium]
MPALIAIPPEITERYIRFSYPDPEHDLAGVRLHQEVRRPRNGPEMSWDSAGGRWIVDFPRPRADRIEYMVELTHTDGSTEVICDPFNQERTSGPFGDKSVVLFPGYSPPGWLSDEDTRGDIDAFDLRCRPFQGQMPILLWSPAGTDPAEPLPLLVANDGPEYGELSALIRFLEHFTGSGDLPRMRAALVGPVERDESYSASAAYSRSFSHEIMPKILQRAPTPHGRRMRVGMGASLGALTMLHIHRRSPATFGGLFLQSGSFFRQRYDSQESDFPRFRRISRFVGEMLSRKDWVHPIPITMTCGTIEENLRNNRAVRDSLSAQGYEVELIENRDGHNWIGWRDTFEPHLLGLLQKVWA